MIKQCGYKLVRSDRKFKNEGIIQKGGGGVCIHVNNTFNVKCIVKSNDKKNNFKSELID